MLTGVWFDFEEIGQKWQWMHHQHRCKCGQQNDKQNQQACENGKTTRKNMILCNSIENRQRITHHFYRLVDGMEDPLNKPHQVSNTDSN